MVIATPNPQDIIPSDTRSQVSIMWYQFHLHANLRCLLGLVGTEKDREETKVHNAAYQDPVKNTRVLNENVNEWLLGTVKIANDGVDTRQPDTNSVHARYLRCLRAQLYSFFEHSLPGKVD